MLCNICRYDAKSQRALLSHIKYTHNITTKEYYDMFNKPGICKNCGKPTSFVNFITGYRDFCSAKCAANSDNTKQKRSNTNILKYGCENISQNDEIKQRKVSTYMKHIDETKEKVKQTNKQRYGCDWFTQSENFKHKAIATCIEKYDVSNYTQSKEYLIKCHITENKNKQFMLDKGYFLVQDLFLDYGTGWYQSKIVPIIIYKQKAYVHQDSLTNIIEYNNKHKYSNKSKVEFEFEKLLYNFTVKTNSRKIIAPYELDLFLSDYKLAIELNGIYRHCIENNCNETYHLMKSIMCREKNIRLIHIYEFEDLEEQKQLLLNLLSGKDNYPKNDFNKNNLINKIPKPEIIYKDDTHTIYGAGKLQKGN